MLLHNALTPQGFKRDCSISYDGVLARKFLSCQAVLLFTHGFKEVTQAKKLFKLIRWITDWRIESLLGWRTFLVRSRKKSKDKDLF